MISSTISLTSFAMSIRISQRLGRYRRIMPLRFSLLPRRRLEYRSAKYVAMPSPSRSRVWRANLFCFNVCSTGSAVFFRSVG